MLNCRAFTGLNKNVGLHISVRWPFIFQWSVQMAAAGPQSAGTRLLQEIRAYCASVPGEVCDLCLMMSEVTWPQRPQNAAHSWTESLCCSCCSKETPCFRFEVSFFVFWLRLALFNAAKLWNIICRFYIESISLLKEHTTVELFFLNAKAAIYNVSTFVSVYPPKWFSVSFLN